MTEKDLYKLKKEIDEAKSSVSEKQGHLKALMNQLTTDWKCDSIKAAENKVKTMENDLEELTDKINESITELEEKYNV